jgi:hypothetical protein
MGMGKVMKVNKRLLQQIAPEGGIRPGEGRHSKQKKRELQAARDAARRASRKKLKRLLDEEDGLI